MLLSKRPSKRFAATWLVASMTPAIVAGQAQTTVTATIADRNDDNRLEQGPGESYLVRAELGQALPRRGARQAPLISFTQMTDMHVVDEESPLRVEFSDKFGPPFTSAYRPQEGLTPQVLNQMVQQLRETVSPVTGRRTQLVMTTGDNTDNTQLNETRWLIDLMDGGARVDPNSGVRGTCGTAPDGRLYDGVRGGQEYYEADRSSTGPDSEDGPGYSPNQPENEREAQRTNAVRDFAGLFETMNRPFRAVGLGLPWYAIFGNHDGLVQGNQPRNPALELIATGCVKVKDLAPGAVAPIQAPTPLSPTSNEISARLYKRLSGALAQAVANPAQSGAQVSVVPRDPRRRPLTKSDYILEHFATRGAPLGHGFNNANIASGQGNYTFVPRPGLRFIVLDSVAENGGADGNIDDTQFRWLHARLSQAEASRQLVMVFAHHTLRTMNQPPISGFPPGDQGGDASPLVHFGNGLGDNVAPCSLTDPASPPTLDETLRCLFLRHRSVIAFVAGHEHASRIVSHARRDALGQADGGFWEVGTASHIDWPQQSRLLDLVDNRDGNVSIFATILDHRAAPDPGDARLSGGPVGAAQLRRLASISRELSFNDPDAQNGEDGFADSRGARTDRNVELIVKHPFAGR